MVGWRPPHTTGHGVIHDAADRPRGAALVVEADREARLLEGRSEVEDAERRCKLVIPDVRLELGEQDVGQSPTPSFRRWSA
jgi:hypothetical protein